MNEFIKVIFGDFTSIQLLGYLWFFIVGYIIYGLTEASSRDVNSTNTPVKWSWGFWFRDNWRRYLTTLLSTYILFRFYTEVSGHPFGYFDAVALGLIGDGIAATLKKKIPAIGGDREQLMVDTTARELVAEQQVVANNLVVDQQVVANNLIAEQKVVAEELVEENNINKE